MRKLKIFFPLLHFSLGVLMLLKETMFGGFFRNEKMGRKSKRVKANKGKKRERKRPIKNSETIFSRSPVARA